MTPLRLLGLSLVLAPAAAHAQSREPAPGQPSGPLLRGDVAGSRQIPGYEPAGVQVGVLRVLPSATALVEGDTNVLDRSADKRGDAYVTFAPALTAAADTGQSRYVVQAEAAVTRFTRLARQNRETWKLGAQATVPLSGRLQATVAGGLARQVEPNFAATAAATVGGPALYDRLHASTRVTADLGPTRLSGGASVERLEYRLISPFNGPAVDQSFRNQRTLALEAEAEHVLAGGQQVFLQADHRWIESLAPLPCCDRSAAGGSVLAGVRTRLGPLIEAEAAGGYQWRRYRSATFRDYGGAAWRVTLEWYATPLVSIALTGRRDILSPGLPAAAGVVVDTLMLRAYYEFRRNLNFILTGTRTHEDYRDTDLAAHAESLRLEARYLIDDRYTLGAYGRYRNRSAAGPDLPRQGNAVEGGMSLRYAM